jgi:hypothetical protein
MLIGLAPSFTCGNSLSIFNLGPPVNVCTTPLWRPEGSVHCKGNAVWSCWLDLLWKSLLYQRHLMRTNCWTLDHWMLASPVAAVHPCLVLNPSLDLRVAVARGSCFVNLAVPNLFRYPVWGQKPGSISWRTHDRLLIEERIFSPACYYAVRTSGHTVEYQIISAVYGSTFTGQSVYFYISNWW